MPDDGIHGPARHLRNDGHDARAEKGDRCRNRARGAAGARLQRRHEAAAHQRRDEDRGGRYHDRGNHEGRTPATGRPPAASSMKETLKPGLTHRFKFKIPATKTVPHLYPEADASQQMPEVLATGYMVGLLEWACIDAINPHLDWPREQSLGTHINVSHLAAT